MRPGRRVLPLALALSFVMPGAFASARSKWSLGRLCHRALVRAGLKPVRTPIFFLTGEDQREIERVASSDEYSAAERYQRLADIWTRARLAHLSEIDRQIVLQSTYFMNQHSVYGIRADDLLESIVARPGMEHSFVKLADHVHDLERLILSFEFLGRIRPDRRPDTQRTDHETEINRIYHETVWRSTWEVLNAIPTHALYAEHARVKRLFAEQSRKPETRVPRDETRLALLMLQKAAGSLHRFRALHRRKFKGHAPNWRLAVNPYATRRTPERNAINNLVQLWYDTDAAISRSQAWLSGPSRPQVIGAKTYAERNRDIREAALRTEWRNLQGLEAETRRLALALVGVIEDFSEQKRQRLRTALELSTLSEADYLKHTRIAKRFAEPRWTE